jgi:hypothetical protein
MKRDDVEIIIHPDLYCHHCAFIDTQEHPELGEKYKSKAHFVVLVCCDKAKEEWDKRHEILKPAIKELQKLEAMDMRSVIPTKNLH